MDLSRRVEFSLLLPKFFLFCQSRRILEWRHRILREKEGIVLNTTGVANLLGVSKSTVQRWIKQLDLDMSRNDLGHFDFTEEEISMLKQIQEQVQKGILLQDVVLPPKKTRKGKAVHTVQNPEMETIIEKINDLDRRVNEKADNVVSYQLLSHRRELEEFENQVVQLNKRIELLEKKLSEVNQTNAPAKLTNLNQIHEKRKGKKKNIFMMLFGF